ncbi:MAG TPA: nuclear transport factor 2 family protein [Usitatibacter sp.]|nr:nuclear transport factor 2 family protein [Usitatibacter sp.]
MPSPERIEEFIGTVERNAHVEAIERFYAPQASMQENDKPPRVGRELLVENERAALLHMHALRSTCMRPVLAAGDHVVIRWVFEFTRPDGTPVKLDELAYQRWAGDRIVEEKFFYDPAQLK